MIYLGCLLFQQELAVRDLFAKVFLIGRREVPLPEGVPAAKFVSLRVHPFSTCIFATQYTKALMFISYKDPEGSGRKQQLELEV